MKYSNLVMAMSLALAAPGLAANPNGAQVVHGSASFSNPSANVLNVHNSHNAVINWQNFNIGAGQTTNFIQPSSASSVLNRVISNQPSAIFGNLNSNGRVFLINQNGLLIGQGAAINTAGFVGSTLNITNEDFLNGRLHFEGGGLGDLENHGYIHAGEDGSIVLIAPNIENGGVIEVEDGNVILAAGKSITITSLQNSAIEFEVSAGDNEVMNLGQIIAHKGAASLFAKTLKHSGHIRASGLVRDADGTIRLVATDSNQVSGEVIAEGGHIEVLGDTVEVQAGASIDASSANAGGEILIGGDQQGLNPNVQNAISTTVAEGAKVKADATDLGNGGKVIVFAENDVHVHGEVTAKGGPNGGDGGFVETSGLRVLDIVNVPDASASNGAPGEWLIDPFDITIQAVGVDTGISGVGTPGPPPQEDFDSTADSAILTTASIITAFEAGSNVTITTGAGGGTGLGNITINDPLIFTLTQNGQTLTLNALNDININADIASTPFNFNLVLNANSGAGNINFNAATPVFSSVPTINIGPSTGTLTVNGNAFINATWDLNANDRIFNALTINAGAQLGGVGGITVWTVNGPFTLDGLFSTLGDVNLLQPMTIGTTGEFDVQQSFGVISGASITNNGLMFFDGFCGEGCSSTSLQVDILNNGTFRVGRHFVEVDGNLVNNGQIDFSSGSFELPGITIGNNLLQAGLRMNPGSILTGVPDTSLLIGSNGTLDLATPLSFGPGIFLGLNQGQITNAQNLTISDAPPPTRVEQQSTLETFLWNGGVLSGEGTFLTPEGSFTLISGGATAQGNSSLTPLEWVNQGLVEWQAGNIALNDARIVNQSEFYIAIGLPVSMNSTTGGEFINDIGALLGMGTSSAVATFNVPVSNLGVLNVATSADTLILTSDLVLEHGALVSGEGLLSMNSGAGVLTLNSGGGISPGQNGDGFLTISGTVVVNPGGYILYDLESPGGDFPPLRTDRIFVFGAIEINGGELVALWEGPGGFDQFIGGETGLPLMSCSISPCLTVNAPMNVRDPINVTGSTLQLVTGTSQDELLFNLGSKAGSVFEWTGAVNQNWSEPGNWLFAGSATTVLPGAADSVVIDSNVPTALLSVDVDDIAGVNVLNLQSDRQLNLTGGALNIGGVGVLATTYVPNTGQGESSGILFNSASAVLGGAGTMTTLPGTYSDFINGAPISIAQWEQAGLLSFESANDFVLNGTSLTNRGAFAVQITDNGADVNGTGSFINSGLMLVANSTASNLNIDLPYSNTSTSDFIISDAGFNLIFGNNTNLQGTLSAASTSAFNFSTGNHDLIGGSALSGQFNVGPGATLNLISQGSAVNMTSASLKLDGGTITQAENLIFPVTLDLLSGVFAANPNSTVNLLSQTSLAGQGNTLTLNAVLELTGPVRWDGGTITGTGELRLSPSFNIELGGNPLSLGASGQVTTLDAIGLVTSASELSFINLIVTNNASVQGLSSGQLLPGNLFVSDSEIAGFADVIAGNLLVNGQAKFTNTRVSYTTGLDIAGLNDELLLEGSTLILDGTPMTGSGALTVGNLSQLAVEAASSTATDISLVLNGGTVQLFENLVIEGGLDWLSGDIFVGDTSGDLITRGETRLVTGFLDANWINESTGRVVWVGDNTSEFIIGDVTITNQGTFRIESFNNPDSQSAATNLAGAKSLTTSGTGAGSFVNQGLLLIDAANGGQADQVDFNLNFDNDGGSIGILSGAFSLGLDANENPVTLVLDQAGESLQGFGTFVGNVDNQAGLVTPGIANLDSAVSSTGTLSISGNYRQGAAGTLAIKLDSTRDGLLHDVLNVSGNVVADGRLRFDLVNGSTALATASLIGQDFRPFNFGSFAGRFDVSTPQGLNLKLNPDGSISIDSENQLLLAISSQITSLIEKRDVRFEDIILNARFVDKIKENLPVQDDDPRKRRFARLVCK